MFPVEVFQKTLAKLITILRRHHIRFHLTGGLTGTAYGEPRMTQDIKLVIDPVQTKHVLDALIERLSASDFLYVEPSLRVAVQDQQELLKLDIYPREMIPGELDRSVWLEIFEGIGIYTSRWI